MSDQQLSLPWKIVDVECVYVVDADGETVLEFEHEMEETARHIVSCVNGKESLKRKLAEAAEALVGACAIVADAHKPGSGYGHTSYKCACVHCEHHRAKTAVVAGVEWEDQ